MQISRKILQEGMASTKALRWPPSPTPSMSEQQPYRGQRGAFRSEVTAGTREGQDGGHQRALPGFKKSKSDNRAERQGLRQEIREDANELFRSDMVAWSRAGADVVRH